MDETMIAPEIEQTSPVPASPMPASLMPASQAGGTAAPTLAIVPNDCSCKGTSGGANGSGDAPATGFIYAIGGMRLVRPNESVSHELWAAADMLQGVVPDLDLDSLVLSQGEYLYLAREICWVLQIDGADLGSAIDAYIVKPRTSVELYDIVTGLRPTDSTDRRFDVIIGPRGPVATPEMCGGLQLPIAVANQVYSFTENVFVRRIAEWSNIPVEWAKQIFRQMLELSDNTGQTDEHRAFNYLIMRYRNLYRMAANMMRGITDIIPPLVPPTEPFEARHAYTLTNVSIRPAEVQGVRRIMDVIFHYEQRSTREPLSWFCRVDTTGQFPFLVRDLARYYPHP